MSDFLFLAFLVLAKFAPGCDRCCRQAVRPVRSKVQARFRIPHLVGFCESTARVVLPAPLKGEKKVSLCAVTLPEGLRVGGGLGGGTVHYPSRTFTESSKAEAALLQRHLSRLQPFGGQPGTGSSACTAAMPRVSPPRSR